ncbi:MAG: L-histidine N(alpha)-methyltransferase [Gammaproteobacteria bacterium]|nr:L-histidine N(alpha)-methyltransferase [Gammaproteobacteria bacterium]
MTARAVRFYDRFPPADSFHAEVLEGLGAYPKRIAPKFFYDTRGSQLFEAICDLPEYYLTRAETEILTAHAPEIARLVGPGSLLIELGSGNSRKVRLLLEALQPAAYLPMDISRDHLLRAAHLLAAEYPWLHVHATCVDYSRRFELPFRSDGPRKIAFFPGSSIGNFEPSEAVAFLRNVARVLRPDGALLIGVDLKKEARVLNAAYNDARGITAQFNLNLLARINRELDGGFILDRFEHRAFYNEAEGRIEMHLASRRRQAVPVGGQQILFAQGETIHTENSYKYGLDEFRNLASQAGFRPLHAWSDRRGLFSVHYLGGTPT